MFIAKGSLTSFPSSWCTERVLVSRAAYFRTQETGTNVVSNTEDSHYKKRVWCCTTNPTTHTLRPRGKKELFWCR